MAANIPQQVVDAILAGVRTADVDVMDVSPDNDFTKLQVTVISPFFDGIAKFKRRDMVNSSLNGLRSEPGFNADIVELRLYSPNEVPAESASPADGEGDEA